MARILYSGQRLGLEQLTRAQAESLDNPPWLRVALWCWAHANQHGHTPTYPGQLRRALQIATPPELSRAVRIARERHLIDACSTSSCLVMPGHALAPCEANHRAAR